MRCFILDDSNDFSKVLQAKLRKSFAQSVHCEEDFDSGLNALKELVKSKKYPDIVFVDYNLGEPRTGIDFLRAALVEVPLSTFVLITDYDDPEVLETAKNLGALHVTKRSGLSTESFLDISIHAISMITNQRTKALVEIERQRVRVFDLAAEIAHEMRNRIGAIGLQTRVLQIRAAQGDFGASIDDVIQRIRNKINESEGLCNTLVGYGFSKKPPLNRALVPISQVFHNHRYDTQCKISFKLVGHAQDKSFYLDEIIMVSIIRNLIENAQKYGGTGVTVNIVVQLLQLQTHECLQVLVEDTGPGIPEEFVESILEPGERAGKELDYQDGGGLGLGLPFCRNFSAAHEYENKSGTIKILDSGGKTFCKFQIEIPGYSR